MISSRRAQILPTSHRARVADPEQCVHIACPSNSADNSSATCMASTGDCNCDEVGCDDPQCFTALAVLPCRAKGERVPGGDLVCQGALDPCISRDLRLFQRRHLEPIKSAECSAGFGKNKKLLCYQPYPSWGISSFGTQCRCSASPLGPCVFNNKQQ